MTDFFFYQLAFKAHSEIKIPSLYGHGYSRVDSLHNAWNESYKDHRGDHGEVLPITKLKTTPSTEKTVQCFVLRINGIAHQNVKIYSHSLFYWKSWVSILIRLQNILKKNIEIFHRVSQLQKMCHTFFYLFKFSTSRRKWKFSCISSRSYKRLLKYWHKQSVFVTQIIFIMALRKVPSVFIKRSLFCRENVWLRRMTTKRRHREVHA